MHVLFAIVGVSIGLGPIQGVQAVKPSASAVSQQQAQPVVLLSVEGMT